MLKHDNLEWRISLILCLLCTNGIFVFGVKVDILEALDEIAGYDLTDEQMRKYHIWPQGIIPYYIDDFSFDKVLRDRIRSNIDQIGKVTGLHFMEIPQPPEDDQNRWVFFLNRKARLGCADVSYSNFTSEGVQRVVLGYDCIEPKDIAEIILSLVGVAPQHNSPDRDNYITVNLKNILPDKHYLFEKLRPEDWMFNKLEYDFGSAGHYNTHKYTLNGAETITLKNPENYIEGSKGLSAIDIKKIRTTYNYISYKGKKHVKVPECDKLFVTGSNFSNYKPSTKSGKRLKLLISPNLSGDLLPENTQNNISNEINSNESHKLKLENNENDSNESDEKLKDSKEDIEDKDIEDEGDNDERINNDDSENLNLETNNDTKNGSDPKSDSESQQQTGTPVSQNVSIEEDIVSTSKVTLLTFTKNDTRSKKKRLKNLLFKSDYETGDEGNNNYKNEKRKIHFE